MSLNTGRGAVGRPPQPDVFDTFYSKADLARRAEREADAKVGGPVGFPPDRLDCFSSTVHGTVQCVSGPGRGASGEPL